MLFTGLLDAIENLQISSCLISGRANCANAYGVWENRDLASTALLRDWFCAFIRSNVISAVDERFGLANESRNVASNA
jgi:hypothetical protein